MEEPGTEEGAPADQSAATNTSDITNMADDIAEVSDDSEDEDEEGMKSAYSMTDMMDELDEGSDDNVNTCTTPGEDKPAAVDINKTKVSVEEGDGADGKCNRDVTAVSDTGQESCDLDVSISVDVRGDTDIITPPVNVNNAPSVDTLDRVVPCSLSPERELSKSPELPDRASKVQTLSQGSATDGSLPHDYEAIGSLQGTANLVGILLPVPDHPGVGIQHMWVCSGEKSRGQITIVSLHTGQPYIVETFKSPGTVSVCAVRIPGTSTDGDVFDDTVWMATEDKKIHIYDILEDSRQGPALSVNTSDMVVTLCYHDNHVYAGHHKGQLAVYSRGTDGVWAHGSPCILQLGTEPVASLLVISNHVWAACGQHLHVIHKGAAPAGQQPEFEQIAHQLAQPEEGSIECMVKAGVGLIVSFRNKGIIRLFHFETLDHLQDINTASVVKNFFDDKQQSTDLRESLKRLSVTCLMASKGLLWVGTTSGCILSLPLPRLEGVPQIRCRPSVSYHAQTGPIKFLMAIHCGITALRPPPPTPTLPSPSESGVSSDGGDETVQTNGFCNTDLNVCGLVKSADYSQIMDHSGHFPEDMTLGGALRSRWISTPDLYLGSSEERMESLHTLYGSLLRGLDDDIDMELGTPKFKRRSKNMLSNLNAVSHRVGKLSGAMLTRLITQDHSQGNRAATLPVLHEDGASSHGNSSSDNVSGGSRQRDSWAESDDFIDPSVIQEDYSNDYENMDIIKQRESVERNIPAAQPHYENAEMYRNGKYNRSVSSEMVDSQSDVVIRSPVMHASHVYNKAVVVVSGGEGYINWNSQKDQNVKSDDTCLLLWQCPP